MRQEPLPRTNFTISKHLSKILFIAEVSKYFRKTLKDERTPNRYITVKDSLTTFLQIFEPFSTV